MPMEWNLLVQITCPESRPSSHDSVQYSRQFWKSPAQNTGMYLVHLAGLLGPISANGVELRLTVEYLLDSFFGRFWHAKMENRSKLLNPTAAAWESWPNFVIYEWDLGTTGQQIIYNVLYPLLYNIWYSRSPHTLCHDEVLKQWGKQDQRNSACRLPCNIACYITSVISQGTFGLHLSLTVPFAFRSMASTSSTAFFSNSLTILSC